MTVIELIEELHGMPEDAQAQFRYKGIPIVINAVTEGDDGEPGTEEESELPASFVTLSHETPEELERLKALEIAQREFVESKIIESNRWVYPHMPDWKAFKNSVYRTRTLAGLEKLKENHAKRQAKYEKRRTA